MTPCIYGFTTLPALMHEVHTCSRCGEPFTMARTFCTFGFQRRLVRRCEWLIRMPKFGRLPQTSQTDAIAQQPRDRGCSGRGVHHTGSPEKPEDDSSRVVSA